MPDDAPLPPEKILGLDPRALLARATEPADTAALLRVWKPPTVAELTGLLPQYEVLALLGRGGMGAVYRARQPALDRFVAIKLLPPEAAADAAFAERFQRETRVLAKLSHPHIVAIYESGRTPAGHLYFVMEHVEGTDLAELLAAGPLAPQRAEEIVREICAALQSAHESGVIHRDVKPANILVARDGTVKVADFGLAELHDAAATAGTRLTQSGTVLGTLDYMAPEQHAGRELDPRADLYSVGVVFYEMLTGRLPRGAWLPPSLARGCSMHLDAVVQRALAPEPADRFGSAAEFAAALTAPRPAASRRRFLRILAGLSTALVGGCWWWWQRQRGNAQPGVLAQVELPGAVTSGAWAWADVRGGTLSLPLDLLPPTKLLRLPVYPGAAGYDFSFELLLGDDRANAGVILKTGATRVGLLLNYFGACGLGLVRGSYWNENETTTTQLVPRGRWQRVEIAVRLEGSRVGIAVRLEGQELLQWAGPQSNLSVYEEADGWRIGDRECLGFASAHGGLQIRAARFTSRG